ncbi:DMT family transporter [Agrococcus carbonis]|uniref:Permease of the drug/metabolite transporter (DMT) superfamily n=1 Tax=Agrococcus carbonis TaxID=684552 RepID=A0A1H1T4G8_9MICO|nr:DMT family transporter [Agrococcus carbonis]SDS54896.1 Permease of the drug/metabolite transporter (DMT) superfamily [Agrococcus carbonis]
MSDSARSRTRLGPTAIVFASVGLVAMWSSGFVGAELAARAGGEPITVLAWRFAVLAGVLVAVMLLARRRWPSWSSWRRQGTIALLSQAGYLLLIFEGVRFGVDGGTAALIAALQPMLVATVAGRILGERANGWMWAGMLLGFGGVALVVSGQVGASGAPLWAHALPLGAVLCLSAGTLLQRRWHMHDDLLQTITMQSIVAGAAFMLVALVRGHAAPPATPEVWAAVLWLVVLSSLGGYVLYVTVTRSHGATYVSTMLYLTPPTTMLWVWLVFGVPVSLLGLVGLAVAAVGVAVVLVAQRRSRT